jgi:hypothetical protein
MTSLYTYDAAYAPKLSTVAKTPGAVAINGYLTGVYANTTTQPAAARAAGLGFIPTYEEGRSELVGASRASGRRVGDKIAAAFRAKGIPLDGSVAVYPSVDVPVAAGSADACNAGWQGIRDVLGGDVSVRAYAEGAVIDALGKAGLVDGKCWLAAPTSWPGFDVNDPRICMVQLVGTNVPGTDRNHLITDPHAIGAWWPDGSPYAGGTVSAQDVITALKSPEGQQLLGQAVATYRIPNHFKSTASIQTLLAYVDERVAATNDRTAATATVVNTVAPRIAQLQAAVDTLAQALQPAQQVVLDTAAVASAAASAVVEQVKALAWSVKP